MVGFTILELAVLRLTCGQGTPLAALMETATVSGRKNTGHGFYTRFDTDPGHPALSEQVGLIDGPNLRVGVGPNELPMGFILWFEERRPTQLEGFQYGTEAADIDLKAWDLSTLTILGDFD